MNISNIKWEKLKKCYICESRDIKIYLDEVRYWEFDISFNLYKCGRLQFYIFKSSSKAKIYFKVL